MRKLLSFIIGALASVPMWGGGADPAAPSAASLTASEAFVKLPAKTLDLLTTSMRRDLIDYYKNDSIYKVRNAMQGLSYIDGAVTDDYIKVRLTPVTELTVRVLPYKKGDLVMTIYTIGDSVQAHDSEIRFYGAGMQELKLTDFIKPASTSDFIDTQGIGKKERGELESLVPFPTVEYAIGPGSDVLSATLTVGEFMGKEAYDKLASRLNRRREYTWTGKKFKEVELPAKN